MGKNLKKRILKVLEDFVVVKFINYKKYWIKLEVFFILILNFKINVFLLFFIYKLILLIFKLNIIRYVEDKNILFKNIKILFIRISFR